eukprot:UN07228
MKVVIPDSDVNGSVHFRFFGSVRFSIFRTVDITIKYIPSTGSRDKKCFSTPS